MRHVLAVAWVGLLVLVALSGDQGRLLAMALALALPLIYLWGKHSAS